jgi:hypothetical protein
LTVYYSSINERKPTIVGSIDVSVVARSPRIIQDHSIIGRATDRALGHGYKIMLPLSAARIGDFEKCHDE